MLLNCAHVNQNQTFESPVGHGHTSSSAKTMVEASAQQLHGEGEHRHGEEGGLEPHNVIGISLVLGFLLMMLIDQCAGGHHHSTGNQVQGNKKFFFLFFFNIYPNFLLYH